MLYMITWKTCHKFYNTPLVEKWVFIPPPGTQTHLSDSLATDKMQQKGTV